MMAKIKVDQTALDKSADVLRKAGARDVAVIADTLNAPPVGRDEAVVDRSHVLTSRHAGAPVYLAIDAMSGKLLGSSARDWRHAVADAPDDWQNGNLNWTDNAKVGDEFHGIRLQMGEVV